MKQKKRSTSPSWHWLLAFLLLPLLAQTVLRGELAVRLIDHLLFLPLVIYLYSLHAFLLPRAFASVLFLFLLLLPDYGVSAFLFASVFILATALLFLLLPPLFAIPSIVDGRTAERVRAMSDYFRVGLLLSGAAAGLLVCAVLPHLFVSGRPLPPPDSRFEAVEAVSVDGTTVMRRVGRREGEAQLLDHYRREFNRFCYTGIAWTQFPDGFIGRARTVLPQPWRRHFAIAVHYRAGGCDLTWVEAERLPPGGSLFPGDPFPADAPPRPVAFRQRDGLYRGQYDARQLSLLSPEMAADSGLNAEFAFVCRQIGDAMLQLDSQPLTAGTTLADEGRRYAESFRQQYADYVNKHEVARNIDGVAALKQEGQASIRGSQYQLQVLIILRNERRIVLLGVCPAEAGARFRTVFDTLAGSLCFAPPAGDSGKSQ